MDRTEDTKSNQWKRFDLDGELTGLVNCLSNLSGAPPVISPPPALTPSTGNLSLLLRVDGAGEFEEKCKEDERSEVVEQVKLVGGGEGRAE
jgi:hypothetical protein